MLVFLNCCPPRPLHLSFHHHRLQTTNSLFAQYTSHPFFPPRDETSDSALHLSLIGSPSHSPPVAPLLTAPLALSFLSSVYSHTFLLTNHCSLAKLTEKKTVSSFLSAYLVWRSSETVPCSFPPPLLDALHLRAIKNVRILVTRRYLCGAHWTPSRATLSLLRHHAHRTC